MNRANYWHLSVLLNPFAGGADDDEQIDQFGELDLDDSGQAQNVIAQVLEPHFASYTAESQARLIDSLAYFLTTHATDFSRVIESILPPFETPRDSRGFFVALWNAISPTQSYLVDPDSFELSDDTIELRQLVKKP